MDTLAGTKQDHFMLHYNFPHYSVGETGREGAPKRREIGHGRLARRGVQAMLPAAERFPYTIRVAPKSPSQMVHHLWRLSAVRRYL